MVPPPIWLIAGGAAVAAGVVALQGGQNGSAAVLAAVAVLLPVAALLADRAYARAGDLDIEKVADRLAAAVRKQWADEVKRREITSPPLAVSWRPASRSLVQEWAYLQQLSSDGAGWPTPAATAAGPHDLAGSGPEILATYDRTPCGRLVILGEPGAGKTALLIRLVLDLIERRKDGEPVPLLIPLASWNPDEQKLNDWLEAQILRSYPELTGTISAGGRSRARTLLDDGLILPILDGLDEIRGGSRDRALARINATLGNHTGIVLSCRAKAYRHAVRPQSDVQPVRLEGAAGVQLQPIPPLVVADYLIATAGEGGQARWAPVRARLTSSGTPLARTLVTPLMASLARTIYNPRDGGSIRGLPDPAGLAALPSVQAIQQHLLAGFVPAAYRSHDDQPSRWDAEQASGHLAFLAHHLEHRMHTTSLAWWQIHHSMPRAVPVLAVGLAGALVYGPATALVYGPANGLMIGLTGGLVTILTAGIGPPGYPPRRMSLRRPQPIDLALGLTSGLVSALLGGFIAWRLGGPPSGLAVGLLLGLAIGLAGGSGLRTPTKIYLAPGPGHVLNQDRTSSLTYGLTYAFFYGLGGGIMTGLAVGTSIGLTVGLTIGSSHGLTVVFGTAWGQLGISRLWLAACGQQPLHLIAFLEDAHARGVLRQAGAVWEFRHAELQRYLAGPP